MCMHVYTYINTHILVYINRYFLPCNADICLQDRNPFLFLHTIFPPQNLPKNPPIIQEKKGKSVKLVVVRETILSIFISS